jgi:tRNA threonylcarbamoyladenosine biosynthesis protein TsaE
MSEASIVTVEVVSGSVETTCRVGVALGGVCRPGDVVLLEGELGAGKTQLVRGLAEGMGVAASGVSSPTFVLMREHASADGERLLVHIDAYRVGSAEELADAGYDEQLRAEAVTAVEWPSRAAGLFEATARVVRVTLEHVADPAEERGEDAEGEAVVHDAGRRRVTVTGPGAIVASVRLACRDA